MRWTVHIAVFLTIESHAHSNGIARCFAALPVFRLSMRVGGRVTLTSGGETATCRGSKDGRASSCVDMFEE